MPDLTDEHVARSVRVHGRVQGVFFRASTRREARRHGVRGWVRNAPDGTVEAHLEGAPAAVEAVVAWMSEGGPPHAAVVRVEAETVPVAGHGEFRIRH